MEGQAENCAEQQCQLACKDVSASELADTPCMDDHQLNPEDFNTTSELAPLCAQTVIQCLSLF